MRIAGRRTDQQWATLKDSLLLEPSLSLWEKAFEQYYRTRINTRYLNPIDSIRRHDTKNGEGFAIVALFCSLLEFLESCERGENFHFIGRSNEVLQPYEYNERQASSYFKDFLRTKKPFDRLVPPELIDSFYKDVRCGLLHEARTKGSWYISTAKSNGILISQESEKITLYRNQLIPALEIYFDDYRSRLLNNPSTQEAFIRKFDFLCQQ
jgi:hypothetical protein